MIGGLTRKTSRLAIIAAAGVFVGGVAMTPASAADLGGDCCADLEERVAELEATTVRKGNRKVSLSLSGHVNTGVLFWDDGFESDAYVVTNNNSRSRFRMKGSAKMGGGWSAGFLIELGVNESTSSQVSQASDDGSQGVAIDVRHNMWYIKGPIGRISVGQTGQAVEGAAEVDLSGTGLSDYQGAGFLTSSFLFRRSGDNVLTDFTSGSVLKDHDGNRRDVVRYDTPSIAGFTLSASWGDDDEYDAALRFANEFGGVLRVAAAIGYLVDDDDNGAKGDFDAILGSISVMHVPTGLNIGYRYVNRDFDGVSTPDETSHGIKVGISQKFFAAGKTSISGTYGWFDDTIATRDGTTLSLTGATASTVASSEANYWGVGIVQKIDAAAMELYAGYRHWTLDSFSLVDGAGAAVAGSEIQDFDTVIVGGRIRF